MIAVIADDLTGAAELGGIGLRYGLEVEINSEVDPQTKADLLVISTDTRSRSQSEAEAIMAKVTEAIAKLQPRLLFKKTDSVLRGHVLAEMQAQMRVLHLHRALLVPANPALGRTLTDGTYYLHGTPLHETSFASDPEFAITSASAVAMVRAAAGQVQVLKPSEPLPPEGIVIGEAKDTADLTAWASQLDETVFAAGASGFFTAILDTLQVKKATEKSTAPATIASPALYVCGSTFSNSRDMVRAEKKAGGPVAYMPAAIAQEEAPSEESFAAWREEVVGYLQERGKAIIAIDPATTGPAATADALRKKMAEGVQLMLEKTEVREIVLEGGATAAAIFDRLGMHQFYPLHEYATGVIRMQVAAKPGLCVTLKPGSYTWTPEIWDFKGTAV
ncbi:four-carbon acid sugar kinase family protein [Botryobacter ruber]|uniref:four-carbon acid sugar kinase family protein n=1 Tax=Botryobacter ruber TaxID=2171629 RepID=UPI000E0B2180|nr:four-carbon acid sugar kinase family protein [Botryobacter ruber]